MLPGGGIWCEALRRLPGYTAKLKDEIQALVRAIVIRRDGGCIFRNSIDAPSCNGFTKSDGPRLILQVDQLITRPNSDTYADTRLIVWFRGNPTVAA